MRSKLLTCLLVVILAGCYTAKKAEKQTDKALSRHPEIVAKIARDAFPCTTVKKDTVKIKTVEVRMVDCPETIHDSVIIRGTDTIRLSSTKVVKVPVPVQGETVYINTTVRDSADYFLIGQELNKVKKENSELSGKVANRNKWLLWLAILSGVLALPWVLKLFKKLPL